MSLQLPEGYSSWLDYAVESFDTRTLTIEGLFSDDNPWPDREAIRDAARRELADLRQQVHEASGYR